MKNERRVSTSRIIHESLIKCQGIGRATQDEPHQPRTGRGCQRRDGRVLTSEDPPIAVLCSLLAAEAVKFAVPDAADKRMPLFRRETEN